MPKVKSYMNPNLPKPTPSPGGQKPPRYKPLPVKPPVRKPKPKPGKGDGDRVTIMPVPRNPGKEKPKPYMPVKPVQPGKTKPGKQNPKLPSKRNDIIRNRRRPEGTK